MPLPGVVTDLLSTFGLGPMRASPLASARLDQLTWRGTAYIRFILLFSGGVEARLPPHFQSASVIGVILLDIRHECASLGIKPPEEFARHEVKVVRNEAGVRDDNHIILRYA
jgi:hypothetical protein